MNSVGNAYEWRFAPTPITGETWYQYPYLPFSSSPIPSGTTVVINTPLTYCYGKPTQWCPDFKRKEPKMRGLFEVCVVDPEEGRIVHEHRVIAKSEDTAKLKTFNSLDGSFEKDIDDYDIIVHKLGDVRAKREVREVCVVTNVVNRFAKDCHDDAM